MQKRIGMAAALTTAALVLGAGTAQASKTNITLAIGAQSSPVSSYRWGASNSATTNTGGGSGAGKVDVQDLSVTKDTDALTPSLVRSVATGEHLQQVAVQFTNGVFTSSYCLRDVVVSSITNAASAGEDRPTDTVAFNFAHFTFTVGTSSFTFSVVDNAPEANPC